VGILNGGQYVGVFTIINDPDNDFTHQIV